MAPSRKLGGIERALSVIANELAQKGFEMIYFSCLKCEPFYELNESIEVVEPNFVRADGLLNKIAFYPKLVLFIRKTVVSQNPDRVLVFGDWFRSIRLYAFRYLIRNVYKP